MKIARWGNSLAVRLPKEAGQRAQLHEGQDVEITVEADGLTIRRRQPHYTLDGLLGEVTPDNLHEETDWGEAAEKEVW